MLTAAQVLITWSHPGRVRSEAAFAAMAGAAPIPASSGQLVRHRLNRSGDRQLNRALHNIVLARMRYDDQTRAYVTRRQAEGRSKREIQRCLKRAVARHCSGSSKPAPGPPTPLTDHRSISSQRVWWKRSTFPLVWGR